MIKNKGKAYAFPLKEYLFNYKFFKNNIIFPYKEKS